MEKIKAHWENVFAVKQEKEVSWYQEYPQTSVEFLTALEFPLDAKIIDIGGGDSYFIDALLDLGYTNLTLLDISANAIDRITKRLGEKATGKVTFIVSDILNFYSEEKYDFWHDRACFHFLTDPEQIDIYAELLNKVVSKKGRVLIGTFSESGPFKCSGLEIQQYNQESLRLIFERDFVLKGCFVEDHITPFDTIQNFLFCGFKRK